MHCLVGVGLWEISLASEIEEHVASLPVASMRRVLRSDGPDGEVDRHWGWMTKRRSRWESGGVLHRDRILSLQYHHGRTVTPRKSDSHCGFHLSIQMFREHRVFTSTNA